MDLMISLHGQLQRMENTQFDQDIISNGNTNLVHLQICFPYLEDLA
jgi:hypothetical protein